nr:MAG TPA: hypothetical protein [Caudoviricetes sp.]
MGELKERLPRLSKTRRLHSSVMTLNYISPNEV